MCNHSETINRCTVSFQLNEAWEAIEFTLRDIEADGDKNPAIWVFMGEILGHLCLAWHRRYLGPDELMKERQEECDLKTVSVPNWGGHFQLVEMATSHPALGPWLSRQKIDYDTISRYLHNAEAALQKLIGDVESGKVDSCDVSFFTGKFESILHNLCLAWHLRYLSGAEISSLDPMVIKELGWWLPLWQWNVHLISLESNRGDRRTVVE